MKRILRWMTLGVVCAALATVLWPCPVQAQDWALYPSTQERPEQFEVMLFDKHAPVGTTNRYRRITLGNLLKDLVIFPDGLTRYVTWIAEDATTPDLRPTSVTETVLTGGGQSGNQTDAVLIPAGPDMATSAWLVLGVPTGVAVPYLVIGPSNAGFDNTQSFTKLATTTTVSEAVYDVWVTNLRYKLIHAAGHYMFLHPTATIPAPPAEG